jgi:hypothetical protein
MWRLSRRASTLQRIVARAPSPMLLDIRRSSISSGHFAIAIFRSIAHARLRFGLSQPTKLLGAKIDLDYQTRLNRARNRNDIS